MLKSRMISGVLGGILLLCVVLSGTWPLRIGVGLVSALMIYELFRATQLRSLLVIPSFIFAALLGAGCIPPHFFEVAVCVFLLVVLTTLLVRHESFHVSDAALAVLFTLFVGCFMGCITKIRLMSGGAYLIWLVFIGAWVSDSCAYFAGRFFGKRKLIPSVSPKKTVAGAVGGALGTGIGFLIFALCFGENLGNISPFSMAVAGLAASAVGQVGDLVASVIKRQYGVKDYGKIMPGHGGAMDRFDSVLFVAPIVYFYLLIAL